MTDEISDRPTLVVAPHPDDETLGCGATIARMRMRGTPVYVVLVTGGGQSPRPPGMSVAELLALRQQEASGALAHLGVDEDHTTMLNFHDGALPPDRSTLTQALSSVIGSTHVAQVMVTSSRDRHPDHATVALATIEAVARNPADVRVYEYAVWQRVPAFGTCRDLVRRLIRDRSEGNLPERARPHLVSTRGFLDQKRQAMAVYQSQLPHFPVGFLEDFFLPFEAFAQVRPAGPAAVARTPREISQEDH
ncbi:PIG-L deacetylase family protein [Ornithinimicrobium sufpigmenti]|uniref:PIG-L deacetylase family protein n=1 Tax=Ornithinimicrobium sufpigmenti TaxID=2508882 RepID=UPI0015E1655E|nr:MULTISPECIES: PIG-L deacetylase family protein [unclassified Ornithinimicrobium]